MLDFIIKYWIDFVFGIVVAILGILYKKLYNSYKRDRELEKKALVENMQKERAQAIKEATQELNSRLCNVEQQNECLKSGILSIFRRLFEQDCRYLLSEDHTVTLDEYEELSKDHDVYKALGGNHNGDRLFNLVVNKVQHQLHAQDDVGQE